MASKEATTGKGTAGKPATETPKSDRRSTSARRPRWSSVYDDQRRAIETAREEGIEEIAIVIERQDKGTTRFEMDREMLAEMLSEISHASSRDATARSLRPSDRLAKSMREAEGSLPAFATKEELFDALEAED